MQVGGGCIFRNTTYILEMENWERMDNLLGHPITPPTHLEIIFL